MTIETEEDLYKLKVVGQIVATTLKQMLALVEPGITTAELDDFGRAVLALHGANSAPKVTYNFPGYTCISVNEEAAHGIPGPRVLQAGDIVNIDVSAEKDGYFADTGGTLVVPPSNPLKNRLIHSTQLALRAACNYAQAGKPLNGIGRAIQSVARGKGFKVIENLCGHGVGRGLHEEPKEIPGYFAPQDKRILHEGMVIAVEPFLSTKSRLAMETADGWTLSSGEGNLSAQFEHTMVITKKRPILLTLAA